MSIRINGIDRPTTINEPSTTPRGSYHLANNGNLYELQRSNNFEFIITGEGFTPGTSALLRAGALGNETNAYIGNAQEVIRLSVISCPIPHFTQDAITVRRGNSVLKYAGVPSFNNGQIVVNDFIGADTKSVLMAWQNLSYNVKTEKVGLVTDYKRDCYLVEYSPDYQEVRRWILHGCWISGLSESDYNSESGDKHDITATIEYDSAVIDMSDLD